MSNANLEGSQARVFTSDRDMALVNGQPIDPRQTFPGHKDPYVAMVEGAHVDPEPIPVVRNAEIIQFPVARIQASGSYRNEGHNVTKLRK